MNWLKELKGSVKEKRDAKKATEAEAAAAGEAEGEAEAAASE